jgi:molecular chaperone GrpE
MCQNERPDDQEEALDAGAADTGIWPAIVDPKPRSDGPLDASAVEQDGGGSSTSLDQEAPIRDESPAVTQSQEFGPRVLAAISQLNQSMEERLSTLETLFDREVRAEATRERILDRLHAELQEYKHDLLLKVQRPIFIDLIQLHDDLGKMMEAQPMDDPQRAEVIRGCLDSVRTAIEDILYRQGVEPFRNDGSEFDPRRQRAVSTLPTEVPEWSKTIAARIRPGFQAGDKLIRPEIVSVYTLRK